MKIMKLWIALVLTCVGGVALAEGGGGHGHSKGPLPPACQSVETACEAAGYHHGGHKEHKGLWKDCVAPLLDGKTVAGVSAKADDVKVCAANRPTDRT
jgi:hypothetical protein